MQNKCGAIVLSDFPSTVKEIEKIVAKDDSTGSGLDKEARKVAIECCSQYLVQGCT